MSNLVLINFDVRNYKDETSLSGYALPQSTFTFIPVLSTPSFVISNTKVLWNFGDGTTSDAPTATHTYEFPGEYRVVLYVYGSGGQSFIDTFTPVISVYDFIDNSLEFSGVTGSEFNIKAGQRGLVTLLRRNSWQSYGSLSAAGYTINLYASGSVDPYINVKRYSSDPWAHLDSQSKFTTQEPAGLSVEYVPASSVKTEDTSIYARLGDDDFEICDSSDSGSFLAGTSGFADVYYTSDEPKNLLSASPPVILFASLDTSRFDDDVTFKKKYYSAVSPSIGYLNTKPTTVPVVKIRYNPAHHLSFSTNGLDTDGDAVLSTFNIPQISWVNTKIPFVVKLKDSSEYSTKFYPLLSSNVYNLSTTSATYNVALALLSGNGSIFTSVSSVSFYADFIEELPADTGGYFKGYFISPTSISIAKLSAAVTVYNPQYYNADTTSNIVSALCSISGSSTPFSIHSYDGVYNVVKNNEDFSFKQYFDKLRISDQLADKNNFFDKFLGTIFGGVTSRPYELGKTVYEKIANFTENTSDVDTANVASLVSMCNSVGIPVEGVNYDYPPQLRRVVDILSIKHKKLFGELNHFNLDFYKVGITDAPGFAVNLGERIDINTGTLSLSEYIVSYEKFSELYKLVSTAAVSSYSLGSTLHLSAINNDAWGWGLTLPVGVSGAEIGVYYDFYRYLDNPDKGIVDSVVNWNDSTLTLSFYNSGYNDWASNDGIMDNVINYEMTKGLRLFLSGTDIVYNS